MSTKIYNGMKVNFPQKTLFTLIQEIKPLAQQEALTEFTNNYKNTYQYLKEKGTEKPRQELKKIFKQKQEYLGYNPYQFKLMFYQCQDNTILCYPSTASFYTCHQQHPAFEEYGYWDNTDKPDEITNKEWEQRQQHWEEAFDEISNWTP